MKYLVEYQLAYAHIVRVGVTARSSGEAETKAREAFDDGAIWDDTKDMPLLYDDYEETEDNTLHFVATKVTKFPPADPSVRASKSHGYLAAARSLLDRVKVHPMDGALRREIIKFLDETAS